MLVLTLIISILVVFSSVVIILTLRRYLRRIELRIKESSEVAARHFHQSQITMRKLAFQGNPAVQFLIQALRLEAPDIIHERSSSFMSLIKNLNISWPVKSSSDIVICTVALGAEYRDIVSPCLDSHKTYAQLHGYQYAVLESGPVSPDRPYSWMKLPLILRLLQDGAKRVLYIDADAMITNTEISLEPFFSKFEDRADIFVAQEAGGRINCGVMFIANTSGARRILDLTWLYDVDVDHPTWEQNALTTLMDDLHEVRLRILIEPRPKSFNSFPVERRLIIHTNDEGIWTAGDFICHFACIRSSALEQMVRAYAKALEHQVTEGATKG